MPKATLLLRENNTTSLTAVVQRALDRKPSASEYDLNLNSCKIEFIQISKPDKCGKVSSLDEGFESDIDSVSIVSSDESFNAETIKNQETDSANGSACSDSDETDSTTTVQTVASKYSTLKKEKEEKGEIDSTEGKDVNGNCDVSLRVAEPAQSKQVFNLVDCLCYTDVNAPELLLFVIKDEVLVFKFDNVDILQKFYASFSTLKALTNQNVYRKNQDSKFNLLQRTDSNGVTHIEVAKDPKGEKNTKQTEEKSNIISLNTPENRIEKEEEIKWQKFNTLGNLKEVKGKDFKTRQRSESIVLPVEDYAVPQKAASIENILDFDSKVSEKKLSSTKIWNSLEDLLSEVKRPERRKKLKGPAPQPPADQNVFKGQYVRVNVKTTNTAEKSAKEHLTKLQYLPNLLTNKAKTTFPLLNSSKPKLVTYQQFKYSEPKKIQESTSNVQGSKQELWTNSVPRLLKKQRSRSETRNFTPMAYRYIDTIQNIHFTSQQPPNFHVVSVNAVNLSPPSSYTSSTHISNLTTNILSANIVNSKQKSHTIHYQNSTPNFSNGKISGVLNVVDASNYSNTISNSTSKFSNDTNDTNFHNGAFNVHSGQSNFKKGTLNLYNGVSNPHNSSSIVNNSASNFHSGQSSFHKNVSNCHNSLTNFHSDPQKEFNRKGTSVQNSAQKSGFFKSSGSLFTKNGANKSNEKYSSHTISNRLFGMSSKLRDFTGSSGTICTRFEKEGRWSSLGDLSSRLSRMDGSLKSVIKKEDGKKKDKKVTFSAYTTVQVV